MKKLALAIGAAVAVLSLASSSFADGRHPGSLLLFPLFDSRPGSLSVITVTNTNTDKSYDPATNLQKGTVDVEYRYIDYYTCAEFNRTERLTPTDTLSVIAAAHNGQQVLGYVYVFAKNTQTRVPISFNYLVGEAICLIGIDACDFAVSPYVFNGVPAEGQATDVDNDGVRDLDGVEYEPAPAELIFPRFFGQGVFSSTLVLINLTGGTKFLATADFLIYNDNEQTFSAEYQFGCQAIIPLSQVSGAFNNSFLATTSNDPDELVGLPTIETGWFHVNGGVASSTSRTIDDPALVGMLIEHFAYFFGGATLPFEKGTQTNGDLLPRNVNGDNN
ncbi:MAG: hypothetical protein U1E76_27710 [Planctomycetota bacterium]